MKQEDISKLVFYNHLSAVITIPEIGSVAASLGGSMSGEMCLAALSFMNLSFHGYLQENVLYNWNW
jgi:hypothetical protein